MSIPPEVTEHGLSIATISVTYYDFKPVREVRAYIEPLYERVNVATLERLYSEAAKEKAIDAMCEEYGDISQSVIQQEEFIYEVEAWLYDKTL